MAYKTRLRRLILLFLTASSAILRAQDAGPSAKAILELSATEQVAFVNRTMELGFPVDRADEMTMLIINRSGLVLPLIESRLEQAMNTNPEQRSFIETASEMIAYAGDETALRAIGRLIALNPSRFRPLVDRALENSRSWRNPFDVAYRGIAIGDEVVSALIAEWADNALRSDRMQRSCAEAMLNRYGRVPGDSEWIADPLVTRLADRRPALRQRIVAFSEEIRRQRKPQ